MNILLHWRTFIHCLLVFVFVVSPLSARAQNDKPNNQTDTLINEGLNLFFDGKFPEAFQKYVAALSQAQQAEDKEQALFIQQHIAVLLLYKSAPELVSDSKETGIATLTQLVDWTQVFIESNRFEDAEAILQSVDDLLAGLAIQAYAYAPAPELREKMAAVYKRLGKIKTSALHLFKASEEAPNLESSFAFHLLAVEQLLEYRLLDEFDTVQPYGESLINQLRYYWDNAQFTDVPNAYNQLLNLYLRYYNRYVSNEETVHSVLVLELIADLYYALGRPQEANEAY